MSAKGPRKRTKNKRNHPSKTTTSQKTAPDFTIDDQKKMAQKILQLGPSTARNGQLSLRTSNPLLDIKNYVDGIDRNVIPSFDFEANPVSPKTAPSTSTTTNTTNATQPTQTTPPTSPRMNLLETPPSSPLSDKVFSPKKKGAERIGVCHAVGNVTNVGNSHSLAGRSFEQCGAFFDAEGEGGDEWVQVLGSKTGLPAAGEGGPGGGAGRRDWGLTPKHLFR